MSIGDNLARWSGSLAQVHRAELRDRYVVSSYPTDLAVQPTHRYFPFGRICWATATDEDRAAWYDKRLVALQAASAYFDNQCDEYRKDKRHTSAERRHKNRVATLRAYIKHADDSLARVGHSGEWMPDAESLANLGETPESWYLYQLQNAAESWNRYCRMLEEYLAQ